MVKCSCDIICLQLLTMRIRLWTAPSVVVMQWPSVQWQVSQCPAQQKRTCLSSRCCFSRMHDVHTFVSTCWTHECQDMKGQCRPFSIRFHAAKNSAPPHKCMLCIGARGNQHCPAHTAATAEGGCPSHQCRLPHQRPACITA